MNKIETKNKKRTKSEVTIIVKINNTKERIEENIKTLGKRVKNRKETYSKSMRDDRKSFRAKRITKRKISQTREFRKIIIISKTMKRKTIKTMTCYLLRLFLS